MTDLALTPDRRAELADLLGNEAKLQLAYPKVAEYMSFSGNLPGTGDDLADGAFDIRLLHFMTGGESENPYWDIVRESVRTGPIERGGRLEINGGKVTGSARLGYAQTVLQATYAYAVPSPETLGWVAEVCDGRGLLEIGAGRGYWAGQLARSGLDVMAFDSEPPDTVANVSFPDMRGQRQVWHHVGTVDDLRNVRLAEEESGRVLLLVWPPGWGNDMAAEALKSYVSVGGDRVIYVGEPQGGKTGTDEFFEGLESGWKLADQDSKFVTWWNLADVAQIWTRRT